MVYNPYDAMDDYDDYHEPPPCDECGGDYGEHERGCSHGPTWRQRLRRRTGEWWLRFYYTPVSIATLHSKLKRCLKRKAARVADDDLPF